MHLHLILTLMAATTVAREYSVTTDLIPPLDPSRFKPTLQELEFLKSTISDDEDIIRERVLEVQQEYVLTHSSYPLPVSCFIKLMTSVGSNEEHSESYFSTLRLLVLKVSFLITYSTTT